MKIETMCVLFTMVFTLGCDPGIINGGADTYKGDAGMHPEHHVRIWVEPIHGLPAEAMRKGCNAWFESGVGCDLVLTQEESDVQIYTDINPCTPGNNGATTLAYAVSGGAIIFNGECLKFSDGEWDTKALAIVAAHEIGHQLGIWSHIERSCVNPPVHPSGELVCGVAIMNPHYNATVSTPRSVDGLAFDIRFEGASVVGAYNHHANESEIGSPFSCAYTIRP